MPELPANVLPRLTQRAAKDDIISLVDGLMNANAVTKPGMMPIKNLAKNGPVGVLKCCCTIASERIDPCQREPSSSLTRRRASATRFAYARRPRQSSQCLVEPMEGTLAISLVGRDSTTEPKWANLSKRTVPVGQQSERILHRGLRSLLHPLWA